MIATILNQTFYLMKNLVHIIRIEFNLYTFMPETSSYPTGIAVIPHLNSEFSCCRSHEVIFEASSSSKRESITPR